MRALVVAAIAALAAGCDGAPAPPPSPSAKKPPDFPPLPDFKPSEDFSRDDFGELAAGEAASFGWNLREGTNHVYTFTQESHLVITASGAGQKAKVLSRTRWEGTTEVIGGGRRGEIDFLASPRGQWIDNQAISSEDLNKIKKTIVRYQVGEDGVFASRQHLSGVEDPKLELFFALPARELKPGEKFVRDVHIAFLAEDSKYHGRQEIVHAGRRKVGRHECVKLLSRVDLEVTPPADGTGRLLGWVAGYFDPVERTFARVDASLAMEVDTRNFARPPDKAVEPYWQLNHVQAETRVTMVLKD